MSDPLTDPRAQHLLAASPGEVGSLASAFRHVADQAQTAASALRGAQGDATWTGTAAEAFRQQLGKLPGDLDKVHRSFVEVADALDAYEPQLGSLQSQFRSIAGRLGTARSDLTTAQGRLSGAQSTLTTATNAPHATAQTPAVVAAHTAVRQLSDAVGRAQGDVGSLEGQGLRLLDEFDHARGRARSAVSGAAGIAPSHSWLSDALADVGHFLSGAGHVAGEVGTFLGHALAGVGKSVLDLVDGKAIMDFIDHPSWKTFGELAKDVAVTASIVAMVAAPFAAPELLAGEGAAVGAEGAAEGGASALGTGLRVLSNVAGDTATVAGGASSASDAAQGHWAEAGVDLVATAAPNLGSMPRSIGQVKGFGDGFANLVGVGEKQAAATEATASGMRDFQSWTDYGLNQTAARQISFPDGTVPASVRGPELLSPTEIRAATESATSAAARASRLALHVGRPVAIGFDKVVVDPTQDVVKHKLDPCAAG